uniref:kallikrein-4-like n=1 Tax=Ictidomys tridecemlineatus TaxID=43179 RepID=UPI001A9E8198|nr:kallikrein-4-like [Ictidomys tridecemlineatus]
MSLQDCSLHNVPASPGQAAQYPEAPEEVEQTQHNSGQDPAAETPPAPTPLDQPAPGTRQPDDEGQLLHAAPRVQRTSGSSHLMPIQLQDPATASDSISPMSITSQCPPPGTSCLVLDWGWLSYGGLGCVCLWVHLRPWLSLSSY